MRLSQRLTLRYEEGSFSITRLNNAATPGDLLNLANAINKVQIAPLQEVIRVERFALMT